MSRDSSLTLTYWNVQGLCNLTKLKQVMNRVNYLHPKILFLQETHLLSGEIIKLRRRWPGQVIAASYSSHSRGVAVLIHKSVPFHILKTIRDPLGRYVIINGRMFNEYCNLVNVYGPNTDEPNFFNNLFLILSSLRGILIVAGDFNCTLDPKFDRSTGIDTSHSQSRIIINQYIKDLNLSDVWRLQNPTKKEFSYYSSSFHTYSRIDYFLISKDLIDYISNCKYSSIV